MIAGTRQKTIGSSAYSNDPLYPFAKAFCEAMDSVLTVESVDYFADPKRAVRCNAAKESLKEFFCNDIVDQDNPMYSPEQINEMTEEANEQFENDIKGMCENAYMADYAPMVGMALPIHKLILMNNVFSQGNVIQKATAVQPSFTVSMERRYLVTPNGDVIDMFLEQNKIADAIDSTAPTRDFDLTLPQKEGQTDIFGALGGVIGDELSITTKICGIFVPQVYVEVGDHLPDADGWYSNKGPIATSAGNYDMWFHVSIPFTPSYGGVSLESAGKNERVLNQPITIRYKQDATTVATLKDTLVGTMNNSKIALNTLAGNITKVKLSAKLSTTNAALDEASVKWDVTSEYVEIPEATPVNTTISPEEVKDVAAMYDANQVTKIMSLTKTVLSEYKDKKIKDFIWETYDELDERSSFAGEFDFAAPAGYALDWVTFRAATFMDFLDDLATQMLQVLNDPNMVISIVGDPRIVRKLTTKEYTYQAPANIGPVTLDYTQTIVNTSDRRVYNFVGSDKLRNTNQLMIILNPRNTERITIRLYDYQLYISNEIRNSSNPALPSIHAFERFKMYKSLPVLASVDILNPSGLR